MVLREQEGKGERTGETDTMGNTGETGLVVPAKKRRTGHNRRTGEKDAKGLKVYTPQSFELKPDTVDILVDYYKNTTKEGNGTGWNEEMKVLRNSYCLSLITQRGFTKTYARNYIQRQFEVSVVTANRWMNEALNTLVVMHSPEEKEQYAALFNERLEEIYSRAMESNRLDIAIKAIESQAKIMGLYNADTTNNTQIIYEFKFGE